MKKHLFLAALVAMFAISCQKDFNEPQVSAQNEEQVAQTFIRSYDEALKIAEEAVAMVDDATTRTSKPRKIMSNCGQIVTLPVTRSGETSEEPIMYIFNNEDNAGFTVVAANRSHPSVIAATEGGNYIYGESTGVEPFDLMMEDVVNYLVVLPEDNLAFKEEIENELHNRFGPKSNIQWGVGSIYGSLYPDGVAYDEAAAIAQAIACDGSDLTYTITNPNSSEYGQTFTISAIDLVRHVRYDHPIFDLNDCTTTIHNQIARLYLEIGYRLSSGTSISLSSKLLSFSINKVKSVLESFGQPTGSVVTFEGDPILPRYIVYFEDYLEDIFVFYGSAGERLPNGGVAHYWISTGFDEYTYEKVKYTLNKFLDPTHPFPNGYTETSRQSCMDYYLYLNWGFDGISNGWFYSGCFDMSAREEYTTINGATSEYDYNFTNVSFFMVNQGVPRT